MLFPQPPLEPFLDKVSFRRRLNNYFLCLILLYTLHLGTSDQGKKEYYSHFAAIEVEYREINTMVIPVKSGRIRMKRQVSGQKSIVGHSFFLDICISFDKYFTKILSIFPPDIQ